MAPASMSPVHVHISPNDWPDRIVEFKICYEEVIAKSSNNLRYCEGLQAIVTRLLEPIGDEFCEFIEKKGYNVEKLGNMAAFKILHGEPIHITEVYLEDRTHRLLLDLYTARPDEERLNAGLRKFVDLLGKVPKSQEIEDLQAECRDYLRGNEAGKFRAVKDMLALMKDEEYSNFEHATWGSCYNSTGKDLSFPFVLLLPSIMYVTPSIGSAMNGGKDFGPLLETRAQYEQPVLITKEFLEKIKNANPLHLPPIVGSLPSQTYLDKLTSDMQSNSYQVSHSLISSDRKGVQTSLWPENIFVPSPAAHPISQHTKRKSKKQKSVLPTLESFTD